MVGNLFPACRKFLLALYLSMPAREALPCKEKKVASSMHAAIRMSLPNAITIGLLAQPASQHGASGRKRKTSRKTPLRRLAQTAILLCEEKVGPKGAMGEISPAHHCIDSISPAPSTLFCHVMLRKQSHDRDTNSVLEMLPTPCAMVIDDTELTE